METLWSKRCHLVGLGLVVASVIMTLVFRYSSLSTHAAHVIDFEEDVFPNADGQLSDENGELVTCDYVTRYQSIDELWDCLVHGPLGYLKRLEKGCPNEELPSALEVLLRKPKNDASKDVKIRKKRSRGAPHLHGPYKMDPNFTLDLRKIEHDAEQGRLDPFIDPFYFEAAEYYKYDATDTKQRQPPWSYRGQAPPKEWHKLEVEKFIVPLNQKLSLNRRDRLVKAALTEISDEQFMLSDYFDPFMDPAEQETLFEILFGDRDDPSKPLKLPQVLKRPDDNSPYEKSGAKRALFNAHERTKHPGYYSFHRLTIPTRLLTQDDLEELKDKLPFSINDVPTEEINWQRAVDLLRQDDYDIPAHKPTDKQEKQIEALIKAAERWGDLDIPDRLKDPSLTPKDKAIIKYQYFIEERHKLKEVRSTVSIPIFPVTYQICQDKEPSPINIVTDKVLNSSLTRYRFGDNLNRFYRFRMFLPSDGTSIVAVTFEDSEPLANRGITMTGGATGGITLNFETMHLKWGVHRGNGSEHLIDGKSADMEVQLIFTYEGLNRNQPYWYTLARQLNDLFAHREKLMVILSVMVKIGKGPSDDDPPMIFEPLAQAAYRMRESYERDPKGEQFRALVTVDYVIRLSDFIPQESEFYTYRGGLTVPPCFSHVMWSVFKEPLIISERQYTEFKMMRAPGRDDSDFVSGNIRHVDDVWVAGENDPKILPSERRHLRKKRIERPVLRSLTADFAHLNEHYDYYYDSSSQKLSTSYLVKVLCLLVSITNIFVH